MKSVDLFFSAFIYAVKLIRSKKLYSYFIPAIILSLLFLIAVSSGKILGNSLEFMEDWWLIGWFVSASKSFISLMAFIVFEFVILVALSPVNSFLTEKVKADITGIETKFSFRTFLRSIRRMAVILSAAISLQITLLIMLWLFSFLLGDWFYELTYLLNTSFFIGFSFFDFSLELEEVKLSESTKFARKNWLYCLLLGLIFNLFIYYPHKYDFLFVYIIGISIVPHLLTIVSARIYYTSLTEK